MVQQLLFNAPLNSWCLCRANCVCTVKKKTTQQSLKRTAVSFSSSTFDGAGRNDAPCRSSITSWDNAGFIQVGSRHHHLLQILMDLQQNNKYGLKHKKYYHIFQLKLRHPSLTAHKVTYVLLYYSIRWSSVLLSSHRQTYCPCKTTDTAAFSTLLWCTRVRHKMMHYSYEFHCLLVMQKLNDWSILSQLMSELFPLHALNT